MPLLMNMKIEGVVGESRSFHHKGWSEISSWNWAMTSNRKTVGHPEQDKTSLNEVSLVKPVGADSPVIRLIFAQGKIIPHVEFSILPMVSKKETQTKYISMQIEGVIIKSIVTGGGIDDNFFKEHITLLFDKIRFEYTRNTMASADGDDATAVDHDFCWDISANAEWNKG